MSVADAPALRELWGPPGQIGYVVTDLEAAARRWTDTIGIGPWRMFEPAPITSFMYNGEPSDVEVGIAMAYMGDMQIELIQQYNDAPSMYLEQLNTYGEGAQHVCFYPSDYDAALAAAVNAGMTIGQEGEIWGVHFAYARGDGGRVIAFAAISDQMRAGRQATVERDAGWDGADPIVRG